ncbi:hypothetical protein MTR_1g116290 [Medicago truncatula]|uniref:Uncharacterized protein n=1 Tax=Medicago truncatula TaxID=3880 RepID=G7IAX5_MEDTR|nr:hypothetical protein MTR_1g116290 [Medicago truncatula]
MGRVFKSKLNFVFAMEKGKGYKHDYGSSEKQRVIGRKGAFDWTISKIIRNNIYVSHLLFLHVQVLDEDGVLRERAGF